MAVNTAEDSLLEPDKDQQAEMSLAQYVVAIGERIRALRTSRGMIRKDLCRQSGVSERYIAQIESGQANISVAMLWKIAHSMDLCIPELFPDDDPANVGPLLAFVARLDPDQQDDALQTLQRRYGQAPQRNRGVALIGLRGAGKSSLGRLLAERFAARFVGISELIEKQAQMTTAELFSLGGQKAYRRHEKKALQEALEFGDRVVLETGGSLVTQAEEFRSLLDAYYTVWVKAAPEEHMNRVTAQGDLRPMAGNAEAMEDLKLILREREAAYSQADYVLDTSGRALTDCAAELAERCGDYLV